MTIDNRSQLITVLHTGPRRYDLPRRARKDLYMVDFICKTAADFAPVRELVEAVQENGYEIVKILDGNGHLVSL